MGFNGVQLNLSGVADYATPCIGSDGSWGSAGGLAIKESFSRGSLDGVMDLLNAMDARAMSAALREAGFGVSPGIEERGREAVLQAVERDVIDAIGLRVDGFGLHDHRAQLGFAAKEPRHVDDTLDFSSEDFLGNIRAARAIQGVLRSHAVTLDLFGDAVASERGSLLFIASNALENNVQGFGFDGIPGKYEVPLSMSEMVDVHGKATRAVALESVCSELGAWVAGSKVGALSPLVPDSTQRILFGSLSLEGVASVVSVIKDGSIGNHAENIGRHHYSRLLAENGLDAHAPTIFEQAEQLGLTVVEADKSRGIYSGPVVGEDHRASLVKFSRDRAVELPISAFDDGGVRPDIGDAVLMKYAAGVLSVATAEKSGHESVGR